MISFLHCASPKAEHENFTSATHFRLPREQMEEFLYKIWLRYSYDVYEPSENEENTTQVLSMLLEREICYAGGLDPGMTSRRRAGIDPPLPTLRLNSEKYRDLPKLRF